jgi:hypothetical protein
MDFNNSSSDEELSFEQRRPLKKRVVEAPSREQEVILLQSSDDDSDDDEIATLRASPVLEMGRHTSQCSTLSQLTANSPHFATQPNSTRTKTPQHTDIKAQQGSKRKNPYSETRDSVLEHSRVASDAARGF